MQDDTPRTIEIPLTKGYVAIIDEIDADLAKRKWQSQVTSSTVYATRNVYPKAKGKSVKARMHRVVLGRKLGRDLEQDELTDHINGNGLDNRRENLRLATHAENSRNSQMPSNNTSGYKGVMWNSKTKKWWASIVVNRKMHKLGSFSDPRIAYEAYCDAARKYFGEFARLD